MFVFLKDQVRKAYNDAISKGLDEVTLPYEPPSDADWTEMGFVKQGDYMVIKDDYERS